MQDTTVSGIRFGSDSGAKPRSITLSLAVQRGDSPARGAQFTGVVALQPGAASLPEHELEQAVNQRCPRPVSAG